MRRDTPTSTVSRLWGLAVFTVYVAALWFVGWYDLRICGGSYNTIVTDALLSAAFFAAFFLPLFPGCPRKAAAVAAVLCYFGERAVKARFGFAKGAVHY